MKILDKELLDFLEQNRELLNENKFEELYNSLDTNNVHIPRWYLTLTLYDADINPLRHMQRVPRKFLYTARDERSINSYNNANVNNIITSLNFANIKDIGIAALWGVRADDIDLLLINKGMIEHNSFTSSSFKNITINNCNKIEESSFKNTECDVVSIKNCGKIGSHAFNKSSVKELILEDINELSWDSFIDCEFLKKITLKNINNIPELSFSWLINLEEVYILDGVKSVSTNIFNNCNKDLIIYCKNEKKPKGWLDNWDSVSLGSNEKFKVIWGYKNV